MLKQLVMHNSKNAWSKYFTLYGALEDDAGVASLTSLVDNDDVAEEADGSNYQN
jgi:hypothetical protein